MENMENSGNLKIVKNLRETGIFKEKPGNSGKM